ncbi:glycosyl transferase (plasmid) [Pseudonocardia sp. EC080610-09]|nr:glycosyl transferase [Pseudonocardia sp. EC080610-09]
MSKSLMFVVLGGHGHVTPTLPLVGELVHRGHHVGYACGPEFADAVTATGTRWVPLPGLPQFRPPAQVGPEVVGLWLRHIFAALAATYPPLLAHAREQRPDAVVYDATNWPARLVADQLGIPAIRTVPNLAANESYSGVDQALTAGLDDDPTMTALAGDIAAFAAEYDVGLDFAATMDVTEALNLVFVPRAFQPAGDSFDDRFRFLGPVLGARPDEQAWASPDPERPLLYVSLGSIFTDHPELHRTCLDAFDDDRWQVCMTIGSTDLGQLGPIPATVQLRPWFPQLQVLAHASAFLTHAGMGSTMEALYHGVPMLTLPQMPEQVVNADRITELSLGHRLDPATLDPASLRRAAEELISSPRIRDSIDRMRAQARDGGGAVAGAEVIEAHLA